MISLKKKKNKKVKKKMISEKNKVKKKNLSNGIYWNPFSKKGRKRDKN